MTDSLASRFEGALASFRDEIRRDTHQLKGDIQEVRQLATENKGRADRLDEEIKQLKETVRSLTPPRGQAPPGRPSASTADAATNARRLVVSGWDQKQHRSTLIQQVETILRGAGQDDGMEELTKQMKLWGPRVYGKIILLDVPEGYSVQEAKAKLELRFQEKGLKLKGDRSPAERHRTSCLVSGAK
eukprot:6465466-Amphidinium_carterae.1